MPISSSQVDASQVDAFRAFNRFHTRLAGALDRHILDSPYSLTEARLLYEIAREPVPTAADLAKRLRLDPAYLSRELRKLGQAGLIEKLPSATDRRAAALSLTSEGRAVFDGLDRAAAAEAAAALKPLSAAERERLVRAMATVTALEVLVAEIAGAFLKNHDPRRERCWIAERDGEILGSVMLVDAGDSVAKLRLLYVEPSARGLGVGGRLIEETLRFARQAGYAKVTLWTNDILTAARRLYERAGFRLVASEPHHSFGQDLVGEYWEKTL